MNKAVIEVLLVVVVILVIFCALTAFIGGNLFNVSTATAIGISVLGVVTLLAVSVFVGLVMDWWDEIEDNHDNS